MPSELVFGNPFASSEGTKVFPFFEVGIVCKVSGDSERFAGMERRKYLALFLLSLFSPYQEYAATGFHFWIFTKPKRSNLDPERDW